MEGPGTPTKGTEGGDLSPRGSTAHGSGQSEAGGSSRQDLRFNLQRSQEMVFSAMPPDKTPAKFRKFYQSDLMHRFLSSALVYFGTLDKHQGLGEYKKKRFDDSGRSLEGEREVIRRQKEMASVYANILLVYCSYEKPQQERQFFEILLEYTAKVLYTAFDRRDWLAIENELSRLFRSEQFNLSHRKNTEKDQSEPLSSYELYHLRHEADPFVSSRILARLHPPRRNCSIHAAMNARSPLVSSVLPTSAEQLQRTLTNKNKKSSMNKSGKSHKSGEEPPSAYLPGVMDEKSAASP